MPKASGNTRTIRPTSGPRTQNYLVFKYETAMSDIDASKSYFSKKSGGYVLTMTGSTHSDDEIAVAKAMANDGLLVVLTPEGGVKFRSGKSKKKEEDYVYADGLVNGYTYEQQTKNPQLGTKQNLTNAIDSALQHARNKNAQIPLIYDKNGKFHRDDIENGLKQFEENASYRFKAVLVVDKNGNVWEHQHHQ